MTWNVVIGIAAFDVSFQRAASISSVSISAVTVRVVARAGHRCRVDERVQAVLHAL